MTLNLELNLDQQMNLELGERYLQLGQDPTCLILCMCA